MSKDNPPPSMTGPMIFGEVLHDCFDNGDTVLGGAPFNVAWHLQAFGAAPIMVTRIGDDALGASIRMSMEDWNMSTDALQTDDKRETGHVNITMKDGEPMYDICHPVAYDEISADDLPWHVAPQMIYHGSLALRSETSRATCKKLCAEHSAQVFLDVNLRDPWWCKEQIMDMVHNADWVKLNQDELQQLTGDNGYAQDTARQWIANHDLQGVIVTHGAKGATIITADSVYTAPPPSVAKVVDPVGAGDAFASICILGLINNWDLQTTLERAQNFAAAIVGQRGATAQDSVLYSTYRQNWQL